MAMMRMMKKVVVCYYHNSKVNDDKDGFFFEKWSIDCNLWGGGGGGGINKIILLLANLQYPGMIPSDGLRGRLNKTVKFLHENPHEFVSFFIGPLDSLHSMWPLGLC